MSLDAPDLAAHGYCPSCGSVVEMRLSYGRERPVCPGCGYIRFSDPKVAVAVVIGDERGVLLVRRAIDPGKGLWSFPAGYVDRGEVLELAAAREVEEELRVPVELRGLVGVYSNQDNPVVLVVYSGTLGAGEIRPDEEEVSEVGVFPLDSLPSMAFPHDRQVLQDWQRQYLGGAGVRAGPGPS